MNSPLLTKTDGNTVGKNPKDVPAQDWPPEHQARPLKRPRLPLKEPKKQIQEVML